MEIPWHILTCLALATTVFGVEIIPGPKIDNSTQDKQTYTLNMEENNRKIDNNSTLLFTITGATSQPSFYFLNPNNTFQFQINPNESDYLFVATQYFDYETQPNIYMLANSDTSLVVILNIINYDDEPPTLTSPMCTMAENTDYNIDNTTCTCQLHDPDGWLAKTSFTVINSNPKASDDLEKEDELFEFELQPNLNDNLKDTTVYITLKQHLDYEKFIYYSFNVEAKDGGNHSTYPNPDVKSIIYVEDLNDMPPEFTNFFTTKQFKEETEQIFTVTAVDGNKGIKATINYTIIDADPGCEPDVCVSIDSHNGTIFVKKIDRDARDISTYQFTIRAQEEAVPAFTTDLNITFFIEDIDDNDPLVISLSDSDGNLNRTFQPEDAKVANFSFLENFAGTLNAKIEISDIDIGENALFTVELLEDDSSEQPYTDAFLVVPTAGYRKADFQVSVKNATYLDYENTPWDNFQFYVHSFGKNTSREDYILIRIALIDYNDEVPIFPNQSYETEVNETIKKGEFIIQVMATDRDAEDKVLKHELVGSPTITDLMFINSSSGEIFVAKDNAFDYDRINPIFVQVKATDHANPPHITIVPVTITLLDVNNKAPTYVVGDIIRVDENQEIGIDLNTSIVASDIDTTRLLSADINWEDSYAMKNSIRLNTSNYDIRKQVEFLDISFNIVDDAGSINITLTVNDQNENNTTPDYELFDTLYLNIIITDWNTDPDFLDKMNTTALITININDLNDNPPIFTNETLQKNRTVYERIQVGTIVGTIEATDKDVGDIVTYECQVIMDKYDWFDTDKYGQITVREDDTVDCDTDKEMYVDINCTATDGVHITPQMFSIYILDVNNKIPDILVNETVSVYEKSDNGTNVTIIDSEDKDRDIPFQIVMCDLTNPKEDCYKSFTIVDNEVKVKIGGDDLNRDEGIRNYTCTVTCMDNPYKEQGGVQNNNVTTFQIILLDINDHTPELQTFELETTENLDKDKSIGKLLGKDIDEGLNAEIDFSILKVLKGDEDYTNRYLFKVDKQGDYYLNDTLKIWTLMSNSSLIDLYGEYEIYLELSDQGTPPRSTETDPDVIVKPKVKLTVEKFNYYAPEFTFPPKDNHSFVLSSEQVPESQLVMYRNNQVLPNITISDDADNKCTDKWDPTFEVDQAESDGIASIFVVNKIDSCTAQLQVNKNYNKGEATSVKNYTITLSAIIKEGKSQEGEKPYNTNIVVIISFANVNQDPIFDQTQGLWNISFLEENETLSHELERTAYYPNVDDSVSVYYFLYTENKTVSDTFTIDMTTGTINLKKKLDYEEIKSYEFEIVASRNTTGKTSNSHSYLDVFVQVIGINYHTPEWEQDSFFGAIMSSYIRGNTILTVIATDKDEIDEGKLRYSINSTFEREGSQSIYNVVDPPFKLDEITGEIKLNFVVDNSMSGHFWFSILVQDALDDYGNGPHYNTTTVTIHIVTADNTVTFRLGNTLEAVEKQKADFLKTISKYLGWDCYAQNIDKDSQNGQDLDNTTVASLYCVDNNTLLTSDVILKKLSNINTFQDMRNDLLAFGLWLQPFTAETTNTENLETVLKTALIGVSVVLGALSLILSITFFLKTRELNRRLNKLTEQKFGSDESDLNRKGINAPTTNIHAVEGSNPVFNNEIIKDDFLKYDKNSIHSGDSDLIGLEDSPEFDMIFDNSNDKEKY